MHAKGCECKGHPFECYNHPKNCPCNESEKDKRIAELEKSLLDARVLMRDLWRLDPSELPSADLANRCKAFMGGG